MRHRAAADSRPSPARWPRAAPAARPAVAGSATAASSCASAMQSGGQHIALPGYRRHLIAFELLDDAVETRHALGSRRAREALPVEQKAHEVGARDRFDLSTQRADRVAVYAREQAPFAPFKLDHTGCELPAQHKPLGLEGAQSDLDTCARQRQ